MIKNLIENRYLHRKIQPFHEGHKKILKYIKKNYQVTILIMDSYGINKKTLSSLVCKKR